MMQTMVKRAAGSLARMVGAAALAACLGSAALAQGLVVGENSYVTDMAALNALMAPITPLVGNPGGSTSSIVQSGFGNTATATIVGSGNLSVIQQAGNNNRAVQAIQGSGTALLLATAGNDNEVLQASAGNDNFQFVGVSGNNNDIAYIQAGDNLAGALALRDSYNTTVVAVQTPQSGNYMMPNAINGLNNAVVVVVPGRMYVLPKN
jgi:hypothetical protein